MESIEPMQNAIVLLFHFLCHAASSFSNCTKYLAYLLSVNTQLFIGKHDKPIGMAIINIINGTDIGIESYPIIIPNITNAIKPGYDA